MEPKKLDTAAPEELNLIFSLDEEAEYFPDTAPDVGARDEDAEAPSFDALIQAVLNSNIEATDVEELSD